MSEIRVDSITDEAGTGAPEITDHYKKSNILGTVSESSGVPTGAIIERGNNANGEFVKYADGTLICLVEMPLSGFSSGRADKTLPVNFSNDTSDFRVAFGTEDQGSSFSRFYNVGSVATFRTDQLRAYFGTSSLDYPVRYMVIGRWY
jgi:hypothetical protein